MARRTKDDALKTKCAIMEAAARAFYARGVVRTSLQEVAAEAGVTRGAVYWHFKDKPELLRAIADASYLPHEDLLDRLVGEDLKNPIADLNAVCCATLNAIANDPHRRRVLTILTQRCEYIEEMDVLLARNQSCREKVLARLTSILEQAQRKKQLARHWTPKAAATALQHMVVGFIITEMEWEKPSRARDRARNEAINGFFRGLQGQPLKPSGR